MCFIIQIIIRFGDFKLKRWLSVMLFKFSNLTSLLRVNGVLENSWTIQAQKAKEVQHLMWLNIYRTFRFASLSILLFVLYYFKWLISGYLEGEIVRFPLHFRTTFSCLNFKKIIMRNPYRVNFAYLRIPWNDVWINQLEHITQHDKWLIYCRIVKTVNKYSL